MKPTLRTLAGLAALLLAQADRETRKWGKVVREAKITAE